MSERHHFLIVFSGSGYAEAALSNVVGELELRGHSVELLSYTGSASQLARSMAERGWRGLRAVAKQVTGKLVGEDALGLGRDERQVDAVIVTSPALWEASRSRGSEDSLRLGLMTDLMWTPLWTELELDALIVSHPVFKELALRRSYPEQALFAGDVPLPKSFCRTLDVPSIRQRFGIKEEQGPVLLVIAEQVDDARLDRLVFQLKQLQQPAQPIFYFGEDRRAADVLRRAAASYGVVARMFGLVDNLEEYYAACDLVLAEASHPLIHPLLALDKPVVLFDADAATRPLAIFLREQASGVTIPEVLRLGSELDALLGNAEELARLRQGALALVDQKGAQRIADALEAAMKQKGSLVGRQAHRQVQAKAPEMAGGGAFEVIGQAAPPPSSSPLPSDEGRFRSTALAIESEQVAPLSAAQARDEMAALILLERDVEKRLAEATHRAGLWERRLDLATQANDSELMGEAQRLLQSSRADETALVKEMDRIRAQKLQLKRWVGGAGAAQSGSPSHTEGKFRSMELNSDLDALKKRFRGNTEEGL
ncbi:MAG: hypothetical protein RBU37_22550 [Myxococcota bacterium]|jgi:hypothetical protein|nr:hypothetical protein [Myxococcota bacterium]